MKRLQNSFDNLRPEQKRWVIWAGIGVAILLVAFVGLSRRSDSQSKEVVDKKEEKLRQIALEPEMVERTMLREQRNRDIEQEGKIQELEDELRKMREKPPPAVPVREVSVPTADEVVRNVPPPPAPSGQGENLYPPAPGQPPNVGRLVKAPPPPPEIEYVGGIGVLNNDRAEEEQARKSAPGKKKDHESVYLPPSMMEAVLITGFDAATVGRAKENPEPLLMRVQAPAILPNSVRANLKGCFIIAEATGSLAKERAEVRLVSLSCIDKVGHSIIDERIKGFVVDADGKIALAGHVVSRMGSATARALLAGAFSGAGQAVQTSATSQSISPLGTTQVLDTAEVGRNMAGGALKEGAETLKDFYIRLVRETTPVIEVNPTKKVTIVVSEGVTLDIKKVDQLGG